LAVVLKPLLVTSTLGCFKKYLDHNKGYMESIMESSDNRLTIYQRPAEILQRLIQFDTTNPPGNEGPCISFINDLLTEFQIDTTILSRTPERPNLIARLRSGQQKVSPLLLYGHVDVVTTKNQEWKHPPFEGRLHDGYIWGRGSLDMKGGIAMMLSAFLRSKFATFYLNSLYLMLGD